MDIIIKSIIFAICFPVGMSLIGGLRKKLKGSRSVSDSNFVKVAQKKLCIHMKIFVDADACLVINIIEKIKKVRRTSSKHHLKG